VSALEYGIGCPTFNFPFPAKMFSWRLGELRRKHVASGRARREATRIVWCARREATRTVWFARSTTFWTSVRLYILCPASLVHLHGEQRAPRNQVPL
jgi:hypothetical protein